MKKTVLLCLLSLLPLGLAQAADQGGWPNWRGPLGAGVAPEGNYPTHWSSTDNVVWKAALAGRGASTPIVSGDRIFVTSASDTENLLECWQLDGRRLWSQPIGQARPGKHQKASGSNSSPATDGQLVFSYFKSGDVAATTLDGHIVWQLNLQEQYGEDTLWWDLGTSPVLTDNAVVIAVMQSGPSYLVALDKATGKQLWQANRELSAPEEANHSYSTPIVTEHAGQTLILTLGADHLTCHAAENGELLWKVGGFNPGQQRFWRSIASPVLAGNLVICPYARGTTLTAIRLDAADESSRIAWQRSDLGSDVPTPAYHSGRLFVVGDKGAVHCLNAADGSTLWSGQLPKHRLDYSSSPIVAGGHLYLTREDATTMVLKAGDQFELVSQNTLPGGSVSTPVFHGDRILLRTYEELYSIGEKR
jgi:outer membrane protein assembly factor BamB